MKFEINVFFFVFFFQIWVELVVLYTHHDYAHCAPRISYPEL